MTTPTKKMARIIAGIAIGSVVVLSIVFLPSGKVEICTQQSCQTFTKADYTILKKTLIEKAENRIPLSFEEFKLLAKIYDYEIKKSGRIPYIREGRIKVEGNSKLDQELLDKITKIIKGK